MTESEPRPGPGDNALLMCFRPDHLNTPPVENATLEPCHRCGSDIWVSPSSVELTRQVKEAGAAMEWVCCCCLDAHDPFELQARIRAEGGHVHAQHTWGDDGKCIYCTVHRASWEKELSEALAAEGLTLEDLQPIIDMMEMNNRPFPTTE